MRKFKVALAVFTFLFVTTAGVRAEMNNYSNLKPVVQNIYLVGYNTQDRKACEDAIYGKKGVYRTMLKPLYNKQFATRFANRLTMACSIGIADARTDQNHLPQIMQMIGF